MKKNIVLSGEGKADSFTQCSGKRVESSWRSWRKEASGFASIEKKVYILEMFMKFWETLYIATSIYRKAIAPGKSYVSKKYICWNLMGLLPSSSIMPVTVGEHGTMHQQQRWTHMYSVFFPQTSKPQVHRRHMALWSYQYKNGAQACLT